LIIAYGNPLRCDDGIAWRAAEQLKPKLPSVAETICVHQLTPELAEQVSQYEAVVFLDAAREGEPGKISCEPISARSADVDFWHHLTPDNLLALCERLFGLRPGAFSVSLCGESFGHGDTLSAVAADSMPKLVDTVVQLVSRITQVGAIVD